MPQFYFDLRDGSHYAPDEFGDAFDSAEEAREHAQAILADLCREEMPDGQERRFACYVRSKDGVVIYSGSLTYQGDWQGR